MSFKYVDKNVLCISHELCIHLHDSHGTAIKRILTLRQSDSYGICKFVIQVFINPKLTVVSYEKILFPEACESVRGFSADVARYREVLVTGLDAEGKPISWQTSGWPARIVQHEMDHLCGRLYTDIMVRSTFTCTCWEKVNRTGGRIYVPFSPK